MGEGLLAASQGSMPLTEIIASNDGTIGSDFSQQVVPLLPFGRWKCSRFSGLVGRGRLRGLQSRFCILQPAFHRRVRGNHEQCLGIRQAQTRPRAYHLGRELLKPASQHRMFTVSPDECINLLDQVSSPLPLLGCDGISYRLVQSSVLGIPVAGVVMQDSY